MLIAQLNSRILLSPRSESLVGETQIQHPLSLVISLWKHCHRLTQRYIFLAVQHPANFQ